MKEKKKAKVFGMISLKNMTSSFNISEKMKLLLILFLFLVCFHGNSQQKKETTVFNEIKRDTMKILDLNIYRDWEVDLTYMQIPEIKYLKKGNERISIISTYDIGINKYGTNDTDFYLIDGNTGKTLFCITLKEGDEISPLHEYQEKIKKQKEEDNAYFNTYKGKDYTKAEWEIFKEQHYKEYERKKESKGFWHDLFKKHDE